MPMGIEDAALGWGVFAGVKFTGYSVVAFLMSRDYRTSRLAAPVIGAARTVIGIVFGAMYGVAVAMLGSVVGPLAMVLFLVGLIPIRLLEWHLLIRLFFDPKGAHPDSRALGRRWRWLGTGASFVLDVPAIVGLVKLGNFWIC